MELNIIEVAVGIAALALTAGLGFLYKRVGGKLDDAIDLIDYIVEAAKDRQLTKEELQEIWKRVNRLRRKESNLLEEK